MAHINPPSAALGRPEPRGRAEGPPVLIAGGGIAGLAAALALARRGIACQVYERRPAFSEEGAGIQIGPNGTRILETLGVAPLLAPLAACPERLALMNGVSGRETASLPLGDFIARRHGSPYWSVHRADLHGALLTRARAEPSIRLSLNAGVIEAQNSSDGVEVVLSNGARQNGAAFIAADGLFSALRSSITGSPAEPRPTGRAAVRAVIAREALPKGVDAKAVHLWMRPKAHIVHYPVRAGAEIALVLVIADEAATPGWSASIVPSWLTASIAGFPEPLASLLRQPQSWRKWSLHALPHPARWCHGRLAVIGDAAHPVMPFLAQGGVLALEDGMVLADCLAEDGVSPQEGLALFAKRRQPRAGKVARASARNGRIYHLDGLLARARDGVIRASRPERLMASYDWLYGWKA